MTWIQRIGAIISLNETSDVFMRKWQEIRRLAWNYLGISRSNVKLLEAKEKISDLKHAIDNRFVSTSFTVDRIELRNIACIAEMIVDSADCDGFEEFANSINALKSKIKKVNIIDTSYLYRHVIPDFFKYSNPYYYMEIDNQESIEKLVVNKEIKLWFGGFNTEEFKSWYKKMMTDFSCDENGNNVAMEFRNKILQEANLWTLRSGTTLKQTLDFILEECAYACAHLKDVIMIYPGKPTNSVVNSMQYNNMKFTHLGYRISNQACQRNEDTGCHFDFEAVDREIVLFMKEKVSNVNFYVIGKNGEPIYVNNALDKSVSEINAKKLNAIAWKNTKTIK